MAEGTTVHEAVGGDPFFVTLVDRFYDGVRADPLLLPMYPDDLAESRRTLTGFLIQYWGGSTAYSDERGHPRLRMRHAPFVIGEAERDAWLKHMHAALERSVDELDVADDLRAELRQKFVDYFDMAAHHMINVGG